MIDLVDMLMADYGLSRFEAVYRFPISVALALWPSRIVARGGELNGPDYVDRAMMKRRREVKAWFERHYTILEPGAVNSEQ